MKQLIFLTVLIHGIFMTSCDKNNDHEMTEDFKFEATVLGRGLDCGETYIISLKNLDTDSEIEDGIYYADNLNQEHKEDGLKIYLNCREPNTDELYPCTHLGPSYPHVVVINIALAK